ncbi:nuclear receptor subfamily 6 group A member 1-like [Anneissia japonica]|uniref:nuclear receptor subfamily 6 group A member 1-like n=1 Tax=Anneissia japonica TaxID=1529436 RepID=UPI001425B7CA|nr:nuclear receptor subfamily 6 group A member 1-like [Anneissia japonica]
MIAWRWGHYPYTEGTQKSPTEPSLTPTYYKDYLPKNEETKTCLICGDRATGLHYGIVSCEGCKGFFKRSICNKRVYRCLRDKNCMMSRQKRNRCQYCRLIKCLQVGMNRKAIREDGMPGGRNKSIGPVKLSADEIERIMSGEDYDRVENAEVAALSPSRSDGFSEQSSPSSNGSVNSSDSDRQDGQPLEADLRRATWYPSSNSSLLPEVEKLIIIETEQQLQLPYEFTSQTNVDYNCLFGLLCKIMDQTLHSEILWAKSVPYSNKIPITDLTLMISNTWAESLVLGALQSHPKNVFVGLSRILENYFPSEDELRRFGQTGIEIIDSMTTTAARYRNMGVNLGEFVCLKTINFLNPEIDSLSDPTAIEEMSKHYCFLLHDHSQLNNKAQAGRFRELMMLLPDVRILARKFNEISVDSIPLLFKAITHVCQVQATAISVPQCRGNEATTSSNFSKST